MSRINAMHTTPVLHIIQHDQATWERYIAWMSHAYRHAERGIAAATRVLGKQDFCWTCDYRYYIWERPFDVDLQDRTETWHWRLFASRRGLALEIEDKYGRPYGEGIKKAGFAGLDHFFKTWEAGDVIP